MIFLIGQDASEVPKIQRVIWSPVSAFTSVSLANWPLGCQRNSEILGVEWGGLGGEVQTEDSGLESPLAVGRLESLPSSRRMRLPALSFSQRVSMPMGSMRALASPLSL